MFTIGIRCELVTDLTVNSEDDTKMSFKTVQVDFFFYMLHKRAN